MSRDLNDLTADCRRRINQVTGECYARGVVMKPYDTLRPPREQAKLWRRGRTLAKITAMAEKLLTLNAPYLADLLIDVGPQPDGPRVTGALPGTSWHQWREACDLYWLWDGDAVWTADEFHEVDGHRLNGYRLMHEIARACNMTVISYTNRLGKKVTDWPHLQLPLDGSPLKRHDWEYVNDAMQATFG